MRVSSPYPLSTLHFGFSLPGKMLHPAGKPLGASLVHSLALCPTRIDSLALGLDGIQENNL